MSTSSNAVDFESIDHLRWLRGYSESEYDSKSRSIKWTPIGTLKRSVWSTIRIKVIR